MMQRITLVGFDTSPGIFSALQNGLVCFQPPLFSCFSRHFLLLFLPPLPSPVSAAFVSGMDESSSRPLARGRGRGQGPRRELTREEMYGFPPGFDFRNLEESVKTLRIPGTLTGGRGHVVENEVLVDTYVINSVINSVINKVRN